MYPTFLHHEQDDHPATKSEACREFAHNYGSMHPEKAWVLTDFDTWERNPYYSGPAVPHPEDNDGIHGEEYQAPALLTPLPKVETQDEDLPF